MSIRPRLSKSSKARPPEPVTSASYVPTIAQNSRRPKKGVKPVVHLPGNRVMYQDSMLPRIPGQVGVRGDRSVTALDVSLAGRNAFVSDEATTLYSEYVAPPLTSPSKHRTKREKQWLTWKNEILPALVTPYLELLMETSSLRDDANLSLRVAPCDCCSGARYLTVVVVRFFKFETITFSVSSCAPAATQLVRSGLFPCSPVYPTLAVDIRVLDFVRRLFLRIAPNYTAWCAAVTDFLGSLGYRLPGDDPLRRRFTNCLQWFISLHDLTIHRVDQNIQDTRQILVPLSTASPPSRTPSHHCNAIEPDNSEDEEEPDGGDSDDEGQSEHVATGKRRRSSEGSVGDDAFTLERPSEFLRHACPACFGGKDCSSVIVVLDACFTQKHNKNASKGGRDPPRTHPASIFLAESYVESWKDFVESTRATHRPTKKAKVSESSDVSEERDHKEYGLQVPKSVLDGCLSSFTAADETRIKGSTTFFDVTGQMTLLCRHDRPLWSLNMHSAGEGQHYTLALLAKLFEHLPQNVVVKLLYDVGCQLHRSCLKWGLLKRYHSRLTFAISIFHAFGHQWPCQIVYHPRKCIGYGLSDGEGAERLWHGISRLIAYGRVAGYYVRIYNLDSQFKSNNEESLFKLGSWLRRKLEACRTKRDEAMAILGSCEVSVDDLRGHWKAQVTAQTKPLPRAHKQKGKSAVEEVLRLRKSRDALQDKISSLRDKIIDRSTSQWDVATAELELDSSKAKLQKMQNQLFKKEQALGVHSKQQLAHLVNSPFLRLRMNARALLIRIRERLRSTKFEFDRLERSYRKHRSEQRLHDHITATAKRREPATHALARKYNKNVEEMVNLIRRGKAPRNATAPARIDTSTLFGLDVDDDIWLDIGLDYDDDPQTAPPLWLADENVRKGIRAMLDMDRCEEEQETLKAERSAMQEWFVEEWEVIKAAIDSAEEEPVRYQLVQRQDKLRRLYATWDKSLGDIPAPDCSPDWGLSLEEAGSARNEYTVGGGVEPAEEVIFDVEYEEDADGLLMEYLDNVDVAQVYRQRDADNGL